MLNFREWFVFCEAMKPADMISAELGPEVLKQLQDILPAGLRDDEKNKYLLTAYHFYKQKTPLETLRNDLVLYKRLVDLNKIKLFSFDDSGNLNSQFKEYSDYLAWTNAMHGMDYDLKKKEEKKYRPTDEDVARLTPIWPKQGEKTDGKIKVYEAMNVADAIILGKGTSYCISQPGNTMYKSYRDDHVATFYFVHDKNRTDNLDVVVVDVGLRKYLKREEEVILLTDRPNRTGTCQNPDDAMKRDTDAGPYMNYLRRMGVDTSIFKNRPQTAKEIAEEKKLGNQIDWLDWFVELTPEQKSAYIGRGHHLSDEQFDYLKKHNRAMMEQYVSTGGYIGDYQFGEILKDNELIKKYFHNRNIAINANNFNNWEQPEIEYILKHKGPIYDELVEKIKKSVIDATEKRESGHSPEEIILQSWEIDILKKLDPQLYQKYLINLSHTGSLGSIDIGEVESDNLDKLHGHTQLRYYLDKGDNENFKRLYKDAANRRMAMPAGYDDDMWYDMNSYMYPEESNWFLFALNRRNYEIADFILKDLLSSDNPYSDSVSSDALSSFALRMLTGPSHVSADDFVKYTAKIVGMGALEFFDIYMAIMNYGHSQLIGDIIDVFLERYNKTTDEKELNELNKHFDLILNNLRLRFRHRPDDEEGDFNAGDLIHKIESTMKSKKSQLAIAAQSDEIEDKLSGIYSRKGNRSWKTGEPLKRGKVS